MAATNISNITSNNGHNHLSPATTATTDKDHKDQIILQSSKTSPQTNMLSPSNDTQQTKQQVNFQGIGLATSQLDTTQIHKGIGKTNPTHSNNHNYMHHHHHHITNSNMLNFDFISIKSKIGVEFRRYALRREDVLSFNSFYKKIESFHQLSAIPFVIFYTDTEDFLLPINNDDNLAKAISSAKYINLHNTNCNNNLPSIIRRPFLKLFIEKKGMHLDYYYGNMTGKYKKNQHLKGLSHFILSSHEQGLRPSISMPEDFRQVSSIIDVDIVPETCRRVRIVKHGSDRPLGFYIRDGTYKRMNAQGQVEIVTGIFISRLVPGGLAESTGLLAVNDEVLEVNGIQVTHGKTLDQVTDMMVANSSNLIITIRPGKINNFP